VEFYFPEEKSGETVIHIRSASRIGYSDLGANRKRIERIRSEFVNYRKRLPGIYTAMGVHAIWIEEDFSSGAPYINNSLRISEEIEDFVSSSFANFNLGMCLSFQCKFEKALSHLEKCLDLSKLADSEVWIKKTIYADTKNGTRWYLAADHALYAECFKKKCDPSGARNQLAMAIDIFRECGAEGWVKKYEGEMALLTPI
jgi:tetratricopeptide (TPR) repeat protein